MLSNNITPVEERKIVDQVTSAMNFRYTSAFFQDLDRVDKQILEIKRYLASKMFAIKTYYFAGTQINWNPVITLNNSASSQYNLKNKFIRSSDWDESELFDPKLQFKDIQTISLVSHDNQKPRFLTSAIINPNIKTSVC